MTPKHPRSTILSNPLSRRRFLRNVGIAMAVPTLESLMPRRGFAATAEGAAANVATTASGAPLRTAFVYFPNGAIQAPWWPTGGGREYELSRTMVPLQGLKDKFQVLGGLNVVAANGGADGGGDHARANGCFLTGVRIKKTNGADYYNGISADQVMAKQMGVITPFRSLEFSCDVILNVGSCDTDYACIYQYNLAWASPTQPLTPEVNPRAMFERLFGAGTPEERAKNLAMRQQQKRSILDFLASERTRISKDTSSRDKQKLDEYFTGVRDIETRIHAAEKNRRPQPSADAPDAAIPKDYTEYMRLMFDMMVLAFQTDSTRIATFMMAGDGNNRDHSNIGINDGHHNLSHHGNRADWMELVTQIDVWYMQQFAYFLQKMEDTKDVDGKSLLHNSQIIYGSGNSDGNRHTHTNLPIILAGGGGGTLNPGQYTRFNNLPLCNLYMNMINRVGGATLPERFGDSTEVLTGV